MQKQILSRQLINCKLQT